ncbi:MAG: 3-octaprenyl-4-hydroxybenzoate carboxy-lyase [Candidatus Micrarchaeota archaeon]|nr:MAG: 3-octaprenyl-4-hydroxybenzoate carboxy-lyase [Candidatus Micrarchaeota archaeon]
MKVILTFRDFLKYLNYKKRLTYINDEIDPELEIACITDIESREHKDNASSLYFNNVKGYKHSVVTNLFGSIQSLRELFDDRIKLFSKILNPYSLKLSDKLNILNRALKLKKRIIEFNQNTYTELKSIYDIPVLKLWPKDASRFITLPLVITEGSDISNMGIYRMQVLDDRATAMHWQILKGGRSDSYDKKELNVTAVIGSDPYAILTGAFPLPDSIDELLFYSFIKGDNRLLRYKSYPLFPIEPEIVIFGKVYTDNLVYEGPFGDHTGYYDRKELYPVFSIDHIFAKRDFIYAASVVGHYYNEDSNIASYIADASLPVIRLLNESIKDLYMPPEGVFTGVAIVSIEKRLPGDAMRAAFSILGFGQLSLTKIVIVVDSDIDIRDEKAVIWAIATRVNPSRDVKVIDETITDSLDPLKLSTGIGSKLIIDATKKGKAEGYMDDFPEVISYDDEIYKRMIKIWRSLNS